MPMSDNDDSEFLAFLRRSLGEDDVSLERLPVFCTSKVYRLRIRGGGPVFCKRKKAERQLLEFLAGMPDTPLLVPLARKEVLEFKGENVLFYEWRDVRPVPLLEMSEDQFSQFVRGCRELHGLMRGVLHALPPLDADAWMRNVRGRCERSAVLRLAFGPVMKLTPAEYRYGEADELVVTHGDFHERNFGFSENGQLTFMDFDLMIRARPVEDFIRLVSDAMHHAATMYNPVRRRRLLSRFAEMIRRLPYPVSDWRLALNRDRLRGASDIFDNRESSFKAVRDFIRRDLPLRFMYKVLADVERTGLTL